MLKNLIKYNIIAFFSLLLNFGLSAQNIYFDYTNSTNTTYSLEEVRKLDFEGDVMNLQLTDGSVYSWNISTIGHFKYDQNPLAIEDALNYANNWQIKVFPNPTQDLLYVSFTLIKTEEIKLYIYNLQGKVLIESNPSKCIKGEQQLSIDISKLPKGKYICRISGQTSTITKQIIKH